MELNFAFATSWCSLDTRVDGAISHCLSQNLEAREDFSAYPTSTVPRLGRILSLLMIEKVMFILEKFPSPGMLVHIYQHST